jgi:serine/threonine protein kinase
MKRDVTESNQEPLRKLDKTSPKKGGIPEYWAPEVWKGNKRDESTDLWSLGIIIYELICLRKPFCAPNIA